MLMTKFERIVKKLMRDNYNHEEYLEKYGFRHGKEFNNYSPNAIDSDYPWLITIGDNVTISTDDMEMLRKLYIPREKQ